MSLTELKRKSMMWKHTDSPEKKVSGTAVSKESHTDNVQEPKKTNDY